MKSEIAKVKAKNPTMVIICISPHELFVHFWISTHPMYLFALFQDHKEAFKVAAGNWAKTKK